MALLSIFCLYAAFSGGKMSFDTHNINEREKIMKKMNLKIVLPAVISVTILAGCGKQATQVFTDPSDVTAASEASAAVADPAATGDSVTVFDYDMKEYVEVGDYLNLNVIYQETEIDDEYIDYAYSSFFNDYASAVEASDFETSRAVVNGDIINLDYCGKKDGVAFDGGTQQGAILEIGSGTFIPGFEEGLVGVMPGEEVDLDLTFPTEYHSEELAGQSVVFTCKVNGIITTDSIIAAANKNLEEGQEPIRSEDDIRDMCRTELIKQAADADKTDLENQIAEQLSTVITQKQAFPQELMDSYDKLVMRSVNNAAAYYNVDAETLLSYYGMTMDDYVAQYSRTQLLNDAALFVIAEEKGLLLSDEDLDARLTKYKEESRMPDEEMYAQLSREEYRVFFMEQDVLEMLSDHYMKK